MNLLLAAGVAVASAVLVERLGLPAYVGRVMARARSCREILADAGRSDLEKERALRSEALGLFGLFGRLAGGSVVAVGLPMAGIGLLDLAGVGSSRGVVATLVRPAFLAAAFGVGALAWAVRRRARR
ncbi:MAG TPA: hypothetical protein VKA44_02655 [Gemmatimonadota bacterium]|nr:hypothetical protein [Gemmatimonadota bacterium]